MRLTWVVLVATLPMAAPAVERDHRASSVWIDAAGELTADGHAAMDLLRAAEADGLDPEDYGLSSLERRQSALRVATGTSSSADIRSLDATITAEVLQLIRDLHQGRVDPGPLGFHIKPGFPPFNDAALLDAAIERHDIKSLADAAAPPFVLYRSLRSTLARYRALAADPNVATRIHIQPTPCHPGQHCQNLDALSNRLVAFGDLTASALTHDESYEGDLVEAVRRFQERHGLETDGVIGTETQAALDVPIGWRVRQIELALERLRWLPDFGPRRLVAVNIPMFQLWAWDAVSSNPVPAFGMKVIVGRSLNTQTPIFLDEMHEVVARPYWNIPTSIVRKEILPALRQDPQYLARQGMEIVEGPGDNARIIGQTPESLDGLATGRLRARQRPGLKNALGLLKFVLANDQQVYLHDTPADELFNRSRRDFSHGCVRIEDPVVLASWALEGSDWTMERLETAIHGTETIYIRLAQPIQVVLFYLTATAQPADGVVHFADDVYGHDRRLDRALIAAKGRAPDARRDRDAR